MSTEKKKFTNVLLNEGTSIYVMGSAGEVADAIQKSEKSDAHFCLLKCVGHTYTFGQGERAYSDVYDVRINTKRVLLIGREYEGVKCKLT